MLGEPGGGREESQIAMRMAKKASDLESLILSNIHSPISYWGAIDPRGLNPSLGSIYSSLLFSHLPRITWPLLLNKLHVLQVHQNLPFSPISILRVSLSRYIYQHNRGQILSVVPPSKNFDQVQDEIGFLRLNQSKTKSKSPCCVNQFQSL
jgi:hypothetical protein